MSGTTRTGLWTCVLLLGLAATTWGSTALCQSGETPYCIAIAQQASAPERFAAEQLQQYLARISGARFPITSAPAAEQPAIVIGTPVSNALVRQRGGRISFSPRQREYDAFVVRTRGDDLILAGANPRSCLYAVYDFLEDELDVFWPSVFSQEEIVPRRDTIRLSPVDREETASFKYRGYTSADVRMLDLMGKRKLNFVGVAYSRCDNAEYWEDYRTELRMRGIKTYSYHHGFHYFLPPEEHFAEHPEYYALRPGDDGMRREPSQFCTHSAEALRLYTDRCLTFMRRHRDVDIFCPGPEDGYGWCMCEQCGGDERWQVKRGLQFGSDRLMHAVNAVAGRAAGEFPDTPILYLGYVATGEVPRTERPLQNVIAMLALFEHSASDLTSSARYYNCEDIRAYYRNNIEQWTRLVPEVIIYEYYCGRGAWHARPYAKTTNMRHSLRYLAEQDVKGLISQGLYNWWRPYLTNHYLLGKLLWNVDTNTDTALREFCDRRYGSAAGPMFDYLRDLDASELDACEIDLKRAERRVEDERTASLVHYQQILLRWRQLYDAIAERYREAVDLFEAGERSRAEALYDEMLRLERATQRLADNTRLQTVINRPAGFYIYSRILRDRYDLGEAPKEPEGTDIHKRGEGPQDVADRLSAASTDVTERAAIVVTADPPLPVPNLVRNGGFERELHFPAGEGIGGPVRGWEEHDTTDADGVTGEQAHGGRYAYRLVGERSISKCIRQRHVGRIILGAPLAEGTRVLCSAWSKSTGADPDGGHYGLTTTGCGQYLGGPKFTKGAHDWEYAERMLTLPGETAEISSLYAMYYDQSGTAYFDDIFLGVGATELTVHVDLPGLRRVTVLDDRGEEILTSGAIADGTDSFERTLQVPTRRTYTVRAEDADGNAYIRHYPERGEQIDLAGLYAGGGVAVETTMTGANPAFPAMGPAAVFDGSIAYGSGVYEGTDDEAVFTLTLDRPRPICGVGIGLKSGSPQSALVSLLIEDRWETIREYEDACLEAVDIVQLPIAVTIAGVKVEISDCPGLKALTEVQLFEDPGVARVGHSKPRE
ncbi:MAG: DUF4838 domain-containing protein [Armatimonadota bacterium]|nr:DUF4838 domain-containing protein [Armatimonadota bacterium]